MDQRDHRERQLHAEHDLAEHEQPAGALFAVENGDADRRNDRQQPGDQPPHPGRQPDVQEPFHHDLARQRGGDRGVLARGEQRHGEQGAGRRRPQRGRQQPVGVLDLGDAGLPGAVEGGCREDQDRGVDEQRQHQRDRAVERGEADRLALARDIAVERAGLDDRGMQIEIMRHHGRPDDADRDIEHRRIGDDPGLRHETRHHRGQIGPRQEQFVDEAAGDHHEQRDDEGFELAEAALLEQQDQQHIEGGEADAPDQRQPEQQLQRDGGADHLRQIARDDRQFAHHPEQKTDRAAVAVAAGLRQIAPRDDPELCRERLQQDRHDVGQQDHRQQRVAEGRPAGEIGGPVAGIHIADRDQIAGPGKGREFPPEARSAGDRDRPEHFGKARQPRPIIRFVTASTVLHGGRIPAFPGRL